MTTNSKPRPGAIDHVRFEKINNRWVAMIFVDPATCVSWQTVGTLRDCELIARTQLSEIPTFFTK